MKIYLVVYDDVELRKNDFDNKEKFCFLSEKDALEDIEENDTDGYVVECEIKSIKATFPPKEKGKLYPVKIDLK